MLDALLISFGVVFVAELGDKSQLMALTFATRYRPVPVLLGITLGTATVHAVSVAIGFGIGFGIDRAVPAGWMRLGAALAFFVCAGWAARAGSLSEVEEHRFRRATGSAVIVTGTAFLLAELGDKTMLAAVTLATQYGPYAAWLGATAGTVAADALAIAVGQVLGTRLPRRVVKVGAVLYFAALGAVMAFRALMELWGNA